MIDFLIVIWFTTFGLVPFLWIVDKGADRILDKGIKRSVEEERKQTLPKMRIVKKKP